MKNQSMVNTGITFKIPWLFTDKNKIPWPNKYKMPDITVASNFILQLPFYSFIMTDGFPQIFFLYKEKYGWDNSDPKCFFFSSLQRVLHQLC